MNIGGLYFNGDGVSQDRQQAQAWFAKAEACDGSADWIREKSAKFRERAARGHLPSVAPPPPGRPLKAPTGLNAVQTALGNLLAQMAVSRAANAAYEDTSGGGNPIDPFWSDQEQQRIWRQARQSEARSNLLSSCASRGLKYTSCPGY